MHAYPYTCHIWHADKRNVEQSNQNNVTLNCNKYFSVFWGVEERNEREHNKKKIKR